MQSGIFCAEGPLLTPTKQCSVTKSSSPVLEQATHIHLVFIHKIILEQIYIKFNTFEIQSIFISEIVVLCLL